MKREKAIQFEKSHLPDSARNTTRSPPVRAQHTRHPLPMEGSFHGCLKTMRHNAIGAWHPTRETGTGRERNGSGKRERGKRRRETRRERGKRETTPHAKHTGRGTDAESPHTTGPLWFTRTCMVTMLESVRLSKRNPRHVHFRKFPQSAPLPLTFIRYIPFLRMLMLVQFAQSCHV